MSRSAATRPALWGHATLATTNAPTEVGESSSFTFATRSGQLLTSIEGDVVTLDFRAR